MAVTRKAPLRAVKTPSPIYQLRIELLDVEPVIWRRILVPGSSAYDFETEGCAVALVDEMMTVGHILGERQAIACVQGFLALVGDERDLA